jgi:DNA repair protein RadC
MKYRPTSTSHHGHRQRLREKFHAAGAERMHDYEALELLLTFAILRRDVKPLAKALIAQFGSLRGVLDASFDELKEFERLGPGPATLIKLVKDLCAIYLLDRAKEKENITSPQRVVHFAQMKLAGLPHEAFMVIFLNIQNEVLRYEILNEGTIDQVAVYPRRIVEKALACHAAAVILAHNHPSGHTDPSEEDKRLTRAIRDAGRLIDLRVIDHIIVGENGYFSFTERGLC